MIQVDCCDEFAMHNAMVVLEMLEIGQYHGE